MRKIALSLFLALAAPAGMLALPATPAAAKFKIDYSIGGVGLHEMRRWGPNDPLSRQQMVWRIEKLRGFLGFPFLKKKDRRHANALIRAYEQRLAGPTADELDARALLSRPRNLAAMPERRLRNLRLRILDLLASPDLQRGTRRALADLRIRVSRELARRAAPALSQDELDARALLARRHNLRAMSLRRLQGLGRKVLDLLASPDLRPGTRAALVDLRDRIQAEARRRTNPPALSQDELDARALLARRHDLRAMARPALRRLRQDITALLSAPGLQRATRQRLARLRAAVQTELRRRNTPALSADERAARILLARRQDLPRMTLRALRRLNADIAYLLASPDLLRPTRQRLVALRARVRSEMRRRMTPAPSAGELGARALLARVRPLDLRRLTRRELRDIRGEATDYLASLEVSRATRARLVRLRQKVIDELRRRRMDMGQISANERQALRLLARTRSLAGLSSAQVENLWMETLDLLSRPGIRPATRRKLVQLRTRLVDNLNARRASAQARRILADTRPPARLSDRQLRTRLNRVRAALRAPGLPPRLFARLRQMLARDRAELRRRIAMREDGGYMDAVTSTAALLADTRPPSSLQTPALRNRIRALRKALALRGLTQRRRSVLRRKLDADRAELRARLMRARDRRRAALRNARVRIGARQAERSTIIAGESGARAIERQLAAAPRLRLSRRFSLQELRARPDLRDYMPAIDLDSIHFGFNEYWVREEEIGKLERIGEAIERIIASNPEEVFLIEGHTDAVGSFDYNQRLSEKRAQAVKQALTQYFNIPPANLVTIGYGERFLKIPTLEAEPENRRVSIRRITPLLER